MYQPIQASGGIQPTTPMRAGRHLTFEGLAAGDSLRLIAGLARHGALVTCA